MFKHTIIFAAIAGSVFALATAEQAAQKDAVKQDRKSILAAMQWVPVGNAGNANDGTGHGGVAYDYDIGKYEVTWTQYAAFLNAVAATDKYALYNAFMGSNATHGGITRGGVSGSYTYSVKIGFQNRPAAYISWYDAIRFANWMTGGATESGSYKITDGGANSGTVAIPDAAQRAAWAAAGKTHVLLPSEDEWYKAAFHKNDGVTGNYWDYPNGTNKAPTATTPAMQIDVSPGSANYGSKVKATTDVGAYSACPTDSPYGTYDQAGNVWEWNEALIKSQRGLRAASFSCNWGHLPAKDRHHFSPTEEISNTGFRVSRVPKVAPAPTTKPAGAK